MAGQCFPLVGGRVMRATRLDGCGRPDTTDPDCVQVTTDGFVSIALTANINEGDAITVTNAAGKTCVNEVPCAELTGYTLTMTFCDVDPDLFAMITGQDPVLDPQTGLAAGFRVNTGKSGCDSGFALEVWSKVPGVTCVGEGAQEPSGYILFPFLQGGVMGDFTIENGAVSFVVQNATTKDGAGWGVGPYDVTLDATGTPGPLVDPIGNKDHMHVQITYVEPPAPSCGCAPYIVTEATGATAGTPGTWTPAGANVIPGDFSEANDMGIVASPTTAWTTGQYVAGTSAGAAGEMNWNGTAWIAGRAV